MNTDLDLNIDLAAVEVIHHSELPRRTLLKHLEGNNFAMQIDNSSLETFTSCARMSQYQLVKARVPAPTAALTYGSAIHEGLEVYYREQFYKRMEREDMLQAIFAAAIKPFDNFTVPPNEWRTPDMAIDTLTRYMNHYQSEPFTLLDAGGPLVEFPFSIPLGVLEYHDTTLNVTWADVVDPTTIPADVDPDELLVLGDVHIYWTGKIDLVINMDNSLWIADHKTSSMGGYSFFDAFYLSNQTIGYVWAAGKIFNTPFAGLLVNAIFGRKPTRTGMGTTFERQRFHYRPDQIDEWEHNTLLLVSDFISNLVRAEFPMMTKACFMYGKCRYHDVCSLPKQHRDILLYSDQYVDATWSPLNK